MMSVHLWKGAQHPLAAAGFVWLVEVALCGKGGKIGCGDKTLLLGQIRRTVLQ
jgi:hypothetical protein